MTDNAAVRKDRWLGWTIAIAGGAATGAGNIVFGVAQLIPNRAISLTLGVISVLFVLVALRGIPRFFASPDALSK